MIEGKDKVELADGDEPFVDLPVEDRMPNADEPPATLVDTEELVGEAAGGEAPVNVRELQRVPVLTYVVVTDEEGNVLGFEANWQPAVRRPEFGARVLNEVRGHVNDVVRTCELVGRLFANPAVPEE